MSIVSYYSKNKKKNNKNKRCAKYNWKPNHCKSDVFDMDIHEREWSYCKEHGCIICLGEVKKRLGGEEITNGFFLCHKEKCRKIIKRNGIASNKIFGATDDLKEKFFNDTFLNASDLFLKELAEDLREDEQEAILYNKEPKPVISSLFLEAIKAKIDAVDGSLLAPSEKELLKGAYIKASGNIDNTIVEKEAAFTVIVGKRREGQKKSEQEKFINNDLEKLDGWNLLSDDQKTKYITEINKTEPSLFSPILDQVREAIKKIKMTERERERERAYRTSHHRMTIPTSRTPILLLRNHHLVILPITFNRN